MGRWAFVTAAFGDREMIQAGIRLSNQAKSFGLFNEIYSFTESDLEVWAPCTKFKYQEFLNKDHKGFGYFSWKPELVMNVLRSDLNFEGVLWADAGCELFYSPWTKKRLIQLLEKASTEGYVSYTLNTPEYRYTKSDLFDYFKTNEQDRQSSQFQATFFSLSGSKGREIAEIWFEASISGIKNLDLSTSSNGESKEFVEHRFDQSTFSLSLKSLGLKPNICAPSGGITTIGSAFRSFFHPVWTCRNRTGISEIPLSFSKLSHMCDEYLHFW